MKKIAVTLVTLLIGSGFTFHSRVFAGTPETTDDTVVISEPVQQQAPEESSDQQSNTPDESGPVAIEQGDAYSLQSIHIANIGLIQAAGLALVKASTNEAKKEAWALLLAHSRAEIQTVLLARELKVNWGRLPDDLAAWKQEVDASLTLIKESSATNFQSVYDAQLTEINTGLVEALDHSLTEGFANSKVETFVNEIYAQAQSALGIEAPVEETTIQ